MEISELPLESLQAIWGDYLQRLDPRHLGEMIKALESGQGLVGYSPDLARMVEVYREMIEKYDRIYNRDKFRYACPQDADTLEFSQQRRRLEMRHMADLAIGAMPDEELQNILEAMSRNRPGTFLREVRQFADKSLDPGFVHAVRIQQELLARVRAGVKIERDRFHCQA